MTSDLGDEKSRQLPKVLLARSCLRQNCLVSEAFQEMLVLC